jgi:hypothetical protein
MTETATLDGLPLDQRQALAYDQWKALSTGGQTPLRQQFRPDRIVQALPAAMLLHVDRGDFGVRFRQRLEGRFVTLAFGEGLGRTIEDIYTDEHLFDVMPRYLEAAITGDPAMTRCSVPQEKQESFNFTRLILPYAGEDGRVNRLFSVFHFDPVALARLSGPLDIRRKPEHKDRRNTGQNTPFPAYDGERRRVG